MFLNANPLCVFHQRKRETVAATVVDHIKSVREAPELRLEWSNLQSLCKPCHDKVRQQEQAAERISALKADSGFRKRYLDGDVEARKQMNDLHAVASGFVGA